MMVRTASLMSTTVTLLTLPEYILVGVSSAVIKHHDQK